MTTLILVAGCASTEVTEQHTQALNGGFSPQDWQVLHTLSPLPEVPADPTNRYADSATR